MKFFALQGLMNGEWVTIDRLKANSRKDAVRRFKAITRPMPKTFRVFPL